MKAQWLRQFWQIIWKTPVQFGHHNCSVMAAGMSFFGMMSLVPLTILGVSMMGYILNSSNDAQLFVSKLLVENFPASAAGMLEQINAIITTPGRVLVNGLSLLGLVWSGMRFFHILQRVFNTIWVGAVQRKFLRGKAAALTTFVVSGLLFWASFVFTSLMAAARKLNISISGIELGDIHLLWRAMEWLTPLVTSTVILLLVYLFIPHTKVSLRSAAIGAAFATVFLQLARWGFSLVMVRFDVYGRVYGPLTSFIIFMSWLYLSMTIILLGAELGSQCQEVFFHRDAGGSGAID